MQICVLAHYSRFQNDELTYTHAWLKTWRNSGASRGPKRECLQKHPFKIFFLLELVTCHFCNIIRALCNTKHTPLSSDVKIYQFFNWMFTWFVWISKQGFHNTRRQRFGQLICATNATVAASANERNETDHTTMISAMLCTSSFTSYKWPLNWWNCKDIGAIHWKKPTLKLHLLFYFTSCTASSYDTEQLNTMWIYRKIWRYMLFEQFPSRPFPCLLIVRLLKFIQKDAPYLCGALHF